MSRVITFSRTFPAYHPRKGQPTNFVEGILNTMAGILPTDYYSFLKLNEGKEQEAEVVFDSIIEDITGFSKNHTIRGGHRFKVGDMFSPRVWSGKPYNSKQIIIAPDIEIKKVWSFLIVDGYVFVGGEKVDQVDIQLIAYNDGLSRQDFNDWFQYPKPFEGQIICWNESVNY